MQARAHNLGTYTTLSHVTCGEGLAEHQIQPPIDNKSPSGGQKSMNKRGFRAARLLLVVRFPLRFSRGLGCRSDGAENLWTNGKVGCVLEYFEPKNELGQ